MSPVRKRNTGHSIIEQLHNRAKAENEDFGFILERYGVERLLYRLSQSPHANDFVLKGAQLFILWKGHSYRVTRDADLLGFGSSETDRLAGMFRDICTAVPSDIDGIELNPGSVRAVTIREDQEYGGVRVTLTGKLHQALIHVQVDIGFGDVITPAPERLTFPTILPLPAPSVLAYPPDTVVAEKFEAVIRLGMANSRMKDFYDLWLLSTLFAFDGDVLSDAIRNTLRRRSTPLPQGTPMAFTKEFREEAQKQTQWRAFVRRFKPEGVPESLDAAIGQVNTFLMPVLDCLRQERHFKQTWSIGGPWCKKTK
jgi:hypothetical protein